MEGDFTQNPWLGHFERNGDISPVGHILQVVVYAANSLTIFCGPEYVCIHRLKGAALKVLPWCARDVTQPILADIQLKSTFTFRE
jgi:hypothetical protein